MPTDAPPVDSREALPPADGAPDTRRAPHVFCIDGYPILLTLLHEIFDEEGYRVTIARPGSDLLERIVAAVPDLILLDLEAGQHASMTLLDQLGSQPMTATVPILLLSTRAALLDDVRGRVIGMQRPIGCLAKPSDVDELIALVSDLLRLPSPPTTDPA